jgi:rod shape-determining protein MreD
LTDRPPFGLSIIELVMTVAFYPVAVAITHWILGVQKLAPGDLGGGGRLI